MAVRPRHDPVSQFSLTARLAFLVVGPMVDLKLISMQTGVFGRRFASKKLTSVQWTAAIWSLSAMLEDWGERRCGCVERGCFWTERRALPRTDI